MGLDGADRICLGFTTAVVLVILLLLVVDPGDGMRRAREKVQSRRAAAAAAAAAGGDGHRATTGSLGTRGAKAPTWLQSHLGDVAAALIAALMTLSWANIGPKWLPSVTLLATPPLGAGVDGRDALLAAVPPAWVHHDAHGNVIASDGRAVADGVTLHTPSLMVPDARTGERDDLYFVGFYVLALTAIRSIVFRMVLMPVAGCFKVQEGMDRHKFCECGWQCMWYTVAFISGLEIQLRSSYWFGACGGPADWREALWSDYPQALHTLEMKRYYLIQLAFWLHMIVVTYVEVRRSDFWMMMLHHCITSWLVATSYMMNYVRIGMAIMVCFDFADIFLPLAKSLRYLRLDPLDDIAFALFAVVWIPTRHFLMLSILVSIVEVSPRVMSCGATLWDVVSGAMVTSCPPTWDYSTGYYWNGEVMIPIYLAVLAGLQALCIIWLFDIAKGVYAFVIYGEADDHRSDDDEEDESRETAATKKEF